MDINSDVTYRTLLINFVGHTPPDGIDQGIEGITLDEVDYSDVSIAQTIEKSANKDGVDVGEPFLAARTMDLTGTVYGVTRAKMFDDLQVLRRTFNARSAFREDPVNKGFLPLYFSVPTDRVDEFPERRIDLKAYLLPRSLRVRSNRDRDGGKEGDAAAARWTAQLQARDPLIYGAEDVVVPWGQWGNGGVLPNRGDMEAVVQATWTVGVTAGTISLTIDGVELVVTVPAGSAGRVITYDGRSRILRLLDNGVLTTRMDLMSADTHPVVAPGGSPYNHVITDATLTTGSLSYSESYA